MAWFKSVLLQRSLAGFDRSRHTITGIVIIVWTTKHVSPLLGSLGLLTIDILTNRTPHDFLATLATRRAPAD